ncbi:hypothetical protein NC652_004078 [Populus alba x Populus x berolinensis]|nr:hypothetical protein NC652_004078 [Populus alba x Populus x berolinensis]
MEEKHHQKTSSREYIFSFPSTPGTLDQDSDFEFGCLTPDSPSCDPNKNSPADHLFFNGRLLPHSFPVLRRQQPTTMLLIDNIYRATSRASSVSCKDSLMSSRSNSTNSSRSSVSSARTSSSDNSERRRLYNNITGTKTPLASKVVMAQLYGSSQRWQHIMPVPTAVLKREDSRRKSGGILVKEGLISNKKQVKKGKRERSGLWRRFFRSFLVACRECHAMEPSTRDDMLQENIIVCDHTAKPRPLSKRAPPVATVALQPLLANADRSSFSPYHFGSGLPASFETFLWELSTAGW